MAYSFAKLSAELQCFCIRENDFNEEDIHNIKGLAELQGFAEGIVGKGSEASKNEQIRKSDISWIHDNNNSHWLFERFGDIISRVNYDHFMFDIEGIESFQFAKYSPGQHYTWHSDTAFGWDNYVRKISCVMMLDDPDTYEGGEFEIVRQGNLDDVETYKLNAGQIIFFASYMPHRCRPVISGERNALVCWVMGKRERP